MKDTPALRIEFNEGYRLTVLPNALLIEVTDYHARPLMLGKRDLRELGLTLLRDVSTKRPARRRKSRTRPRPDSEV
jgi:hypothetical protein